MSNYIVSAKTRQKLSDYHKRRRETIGKRDKDGRVIVSFSQSANLMRVRWALVLSDGWLERIYASGITKRKLVVRGGKKLFPVSAMHGWGEFEALRAMGMNEWVKVDLAQCDVGIRKNVQCTDYTPLHSVANEV